MTKKKLKGYVAFALFLAVIFVGTLYGPPHGWLVISSLVIAVRSGFWVRLPYWKRMRMTADVDRAN